MEVWDLFDRDRKITDRKINSNEKTPEGYFRLVVHLCLFNSKGELLIQQREYFKEGWPGFWDITVGGHAQSGDSSQRAIEREVFEEIGIRIDFSDKRPDFTINFRDGFDDIYILRSDIDVLDCVLQKEEVREIKWATKDEVKDMISSGLFIPYHPSFIDLIFHLNEGMGFYTGFDKSKKRQ